MACQGVRRGRTRCPAASSGSGRPAGPRSRRRSSSASCSRSHVMRQPRVRRANREPSIATSLTCGQPGRRADGMGAGGLVTGASFWAVAAGLPHPVGSPRRRRSRSERRAPRARERAFSSSRVTASPRISWIAACQAGSARDTADSPAGVSASRDERRFAGFGCAYCSPASPSRSTICLSFRRRSRRRRRGPRRVCPGGRGCSAAARSTRLLCRSPPSRVRRPRCRAAFHLDEVGEDRVEIP